MGNFLDNVLTEIKQGLASGKANDGTPIGKVKAMAKSFGVDLENADLGSMAKGVIGIIGLAGKSVKGEGMADDGSAKTESTPQASES